jgi:hypothetical protein
MGARRRLVGGSRAKLRQQCGTALLGVELFPEHNIPTYSGGNCPPGSGVAAWPCTPEGAYAHELGHTLGLAHPADVPATSGVAGHSIMQTHWNYPVHAQPGERPWGFLTLERQTLLGNPFMARNVGLQQPHGGCDVVNLPSAGPAPVASLVRNPGPSFVFDAENTSSGGSHAYWTFRDGGASGAWDAYHVYAASGTYAVTLRSMAANAMIDTASAIVTAQVTGVRDALPSSGLELRPAWPNPFADRTALAFHVPASGPSISRSSASTGAASAPSRTVSSGGTAPGGVGRSRRSRPAGCSRLFLGRLRVAARSVSRPIVVSR